MVTRGNLGEPEINFRLNDEGTAVFGQVTRENVGRRLAIVLDGDLYSAPTINSPIETGSGQITGRFDCARRWSWRTCWRIPSRRRCGCCIPRTWTPRSARIPFAAACGR